jgi:hypothetical protein
MQYCLHASLYTYINIPVILVILYIFDHSYKYIYEMTKYTIDNTRNDAFIVSLDVGPLNYCITI